MHHSVTANQDFAGKRGHLLDYLLTVAFRINQPKTSKPVSLGPNNGILCETRYVQLGKNMTSVCVCMHVCIYLCFSMYACTSVCMYVRTFVL